MEFEGLVGDTTFIFDVLDEEAFVVVLSGNSSGIGVAMAT